MQLMQGQKRDLDQVNNGGQMGSASKHRKTSPSPRRPLQQQKQKQKQPINHVSTGLTDKQRELQRQRAQLPIYQYTSKIRRALQTESPGVSAPVLLLVGETGSGKSTQVPQYLAGEGWMKRGIAITQPRRVAAINLARRVADETCTTVGDHVGYSVRFDRQTSDQTRLKYLTEGTLLQEMLRDPFLKAYDCVILDEVHERSVDCDLLLGFLMRIVTNPKARRKEGVEPLRVVIMSATANVEELFDFFEEGFTGEKPRKKVIAKPAAAATSGVVANGTSSLVEINTADRSGKGKKSHASAKNRLQKLLHDKLGNSSSEGKPAVNGDSSSSTIKKSLDEHEANIKEEDEEDVEVISDNVTSIHVQGRQYPVDLHYLTHRPDEYVDAAFAKVMEIHKREALPGDILVFLTGQDTVESLTAQLRDKSASLPPELPKILPLPLFAALPRQQQQSIFSKTPPNIRKIVIATNIAETSLTISGVRYVVDAGRVKSKEFRPTLHLDTLLERAISKASATQRMGRAGREAPGKCYRLYTETQFKAMPDRTTPELLRADLLPVVLNLHARGVDNLAAFPLLTRPDEAKLKEAFIRLRSLGGFDDQGKLTKAGQLMARLPIHPSYAKVILAAHAHDKSATAQQGTSASRRDAVESLTLLAIDTVAALQTDEPLALPLPSTLTSTQAEEDDRTETDAYNDKTALQATLHRREGDHLTAHAILANYAAAPAKGSWCTARHLSARALRNTLEVRAQLRTTCAALKLVSKDTLASALAAEDSGTDVPRPSDDQAALLARCLLAGFADNVALLHAGDNGGGGGVYKTALGANRVDIHPSSVLFGRKCEALVFSESVYTTRAYARGVSAVQLDWVQEVFAGEF